ncbi:MAG: MerR family transcriptional regulator [Clostridiales bacterium]|nr:MerR family transcriptional regulator [Clostridiales bacterium]
MKDLLSIHEFAKVSGIETTTLRYWDEMGLFSPIKRSNENKYRYYSPVQLLALNFVTTLSDLEIPLKTIAELRDERDPVNFLKLLEKQERQMDMEMQQLRMRYSIIHARQELIRYGIRVDETQISVLYREDKALILWPRNEYQEGETFINSLASYVSRSDELRINLDFPVGGYWDSLETFEDAPSQPDYFFTIDPVGTHIRKSGDYLIGFTRGYYGDMGDLPMRMKAYTDENRLKVSGPVYVMYLHDEICTLEPDKFLAQACIAVSSA